MIVCSVNERTETFKGPDDSYNRQREGDSGALAWAKSEGRPHQYRKTEEARWIGGIGLIPER